ncbi:hypothetical protein K458DRAFT_98442 [Lentithecium fluviatile CBS 122367]|uniref:REJ domain-containing protein n=1 Tax=Lentithecium fluviatile CBS 122367 TaxID=1168545 RepID=A0A6G1JIK0_9PLEO|nr:hypothetical protein K458DRAFT_98442 [Lentithecium fluviatile CBS 122367]
MAPCPQRSHSCLLVRLTRLLLVRPMPWIRSSRSWSRVVQSFHSPGPRSGAAAHYESGTQSAIIPVTRSHKCDVACSERQHSMPAAYRHYVGCVSSHPWAHGPALMVYLHLLVLPLSLSAHYCVSTSRTITCPSVSSPPPLSLSPRSGPSASTTPLKSCTPYIPVTLSSHPTLTLPVRPRSSGLSINI